MISGSSDDAKQRFVFLLDCRCSTCEWHEKAVRYFWVSWWWHVSVFLRPVCRERMNIRQGENLWIWRIANTIARCITNTLSYLAVSRYARSLAYAHAYVRSLAVTYFSQPLVCTLFHDKLTPVHPFIAYSTAYMLRVLLMWLWPLNSVLHARSVDLLSLSTVDRPSDVSFAHLCFSAGNCGSSDVSWICT